MILRSKIYFMRAPARSAILSKNWLYRQTERPERSAPVFFLYFLFFCRFSRPTRQQSSGSLPKAALFWFAMRFSQSAHACFSF